MKNIFRHKGGIMNKRDNRQKKHTITTDLFTLIDAVSSELGKNEAHLIPYAVQSILNNNKITFINKQKNKTNH
jgi:hypothetical protein